MAKSSTSKKNTRSTTKSTPAVKKSSSPKGKGTSKTSNNRTVNRQDVERNYKIKYELKLIALIAITVFIMLSLYTKAVGNVGHFISNVFLGTFSYVGYLIPVLAFVLFFVYLNPNFKPAKGRIAIALVFILIGALCLSTLIAYDGIERQKLALRDHYLSIKQIQLSYESGKSLLGGGVFGDIITISSVKLIGIIGTYILIIVTFIAGFIIFTKISIQDLWDYKKKHSEERRAIRQQERAIESEIEAEIIQNKLQNQTKKIQLNKPKDTFDSSEMGLLDEFDLMRRASKKKDLKVFDSDYYEMDDVDKSTSDISNLNIQSAEISQECQESITVQSDDVHEYEMNIELVNEGKTKSVSERDDGKNKVVKTKNSIEKIAISKAPKSINESEPSKESSASIDFHDHAAVVPSQPDKIKASDIDAQTRQHVNDEIRIGTTKVIEDYRLPPIELLNEDQSAQVVEDKSEYIEMAKLLEETLNNFNVDAKVVSVKRGPSITMFEVQPSPGVKVSKIVGLSEDISLNLATTQVRIAPIPGKAAIGIEVPNKTTSMVTIREVISSPDFKKQKSKLTIGLGKDISGNPIIGDLANMPHLLIAGATGSGKSVCVNTIISSILFNAKPDEVKFLMIDPKVVELSNYNGIPHLILPVVTDAKKASIALNWAVNEMTRRYKLFAEQVVRDMKSYNKKAELAGLEILPQIVVIIDELADLMMVAPNVVEDAICRLAQMARAAGIHLIVATQRPSVDVITGLIKANIPSRIAFSVSSSIDSRTIIDMGGAEKLLGRGDMLYYPVGASKPKRAQGAFMSDEEVEALVNYIKNQNHEVTYNEEILDDVQSVNMNSDDVDEYLEDAIAFVIDTGQASASLMQRRFRVGYNRAARLIDSMEERGIIGPNRGSKPREVLISSDEYKSLVASNDLDDTQIESTDYDHYDTSFNSEDEYQDEV